MILQGLPGFHLWRHIPGAQQRSIRWPDGPSKPPEAWSQTGEADPGRREYGSSRPVGASRLVRSCPVRACTSSPLVGAMSPPTAAADPSFKPSPAPPPNPCLLGNIISEEACSPARVLTGNVSNQTLVSNQLSGAVIRLGAVVCGLGVLALSAPPMCPQLCLGRLRALDRGGGRLVTIVLLNSPSQTALPGPWRSASLPCR